MSAPNILPAMAIPTRGFCGIGLANPKTHWNVGGALRAAYSFGARFVAVQGDRYQRASTDTPGYHLHAPLFVTDDLLSVVPYDCEPVAVDIVPGAVPLDEFRHTPRAFYIFGPEDGTLGKSITDRCSRSIVIPGRMCINLAAAVNVVLYDRVAKQRRESRRAAA